MKSKIKEIFISTQGEGPIIGSKQMFIRFCGCNLNCNYCDTDFACDGEVMEFTAQELAGKITTYKGFEQIHSISLTGGEPLLHSDFLVEFLPKIDKPIYLETNATLDKEVLKVFDYIDFIAADIKLPSSSGLENSFELHDKFFKALKNETLNCAVTKQFDCLKIDTFAKIVFNENITEEEIDNCIYLGEKYKLPLVLQPEMNGEKLELSTKFIEETFDKFLNLYKNVRLIPQVHKFLNIQ